MDKNCAIARDLMPQVIDNVASDESKTFVEDHIVGCEPCAQVFKDMRADIHGGQTADAAGQPVKFQTAMAQLKKAMTWKRIRIAAVAALVTAAVLFLISLGYYLLFVQGGYALPNEDYELHLFQSEDNTVYLIPRFLKSIDFFGVSTSFDQDGGIVYVHWMSARIPTGRDIVPRWYPDAILQLTMADDHTLYYHDTFAVQEIRQGTKDDYVVAYRAGDPIPQLDPAIADYMRQRDLYYERIDAASEVMQEADRMSFEAQTEYQEYLDQWAAGQSAQPQETLAP